MHLSKAGWISVPGVLHKPSPNFNARPAGVSVELLVIHNISLPPGEYGTGFAAALFLNQLDFGAHPWFANIRGLQVSSHFLIERDGLTTQFVSCDDRAWHAGVSQFGGRTSCNDFSIGIELEGTDADRFTDAQYAELTKLTVQLRARYPLSNVRGHSDIAPGRKTDPGPLFDWRRYAQTASWDEQQLPPHARLIP